MLDHVQVVGGDRLGEVASDSLIIGEEENTARGSTTTLGTEYKQTRTDQQLVSCSFDTNGFCRYHRVMGTVRGKQTARKGSGRAKKLPGSAMKEFTCGSVGGQLLTSVPGWLNSQPDNRAAEQVLGAGEGGKSFCSTNRNKRVLGE